MNKFKLAILASLSVLTFSTAAVAMHHEAGEKLAPPAKVMEPESFDKTKSKTLENQLKRQEILTKAQACVTASTDMAQLKMCKQTEMSAVKTLWTDSHSKKCHVKK